MKPNKFIKMARLCYSLRNNVSKAVLAVALTAALLFTAALSDAQIAVTSTPNDVKNYSTAYFPGTNDYVMAGTAFDVFRPLQSSLLT